MRGELGWHESPPLQPPVSLILVFPLLKAWIIFLYQIIHKKVINVG